MAEKENLGYQILSLAQNADNRNIFKRKVCTLLCEQYECRKASITIEEEESFTTWQAERTTDDEYLFTKSQDSFRDSMESQSDSVDFTWSGTFDIGKKIIGTLVLNPADGTIINEDDSDHLTHIAKILGRAIYFRRSQAALKERVKEITCLYEITQIMHQPVEALEETLKKVIKVIPKAFQYPVHAAACIELDEQSQGCREAEEDTQYLTSQIIISGKKRGTLKVWYKDAGQTSEDREFLQEEQDLLDGITTQLSLLIEERETELEKQKLEEQLRHADRLATLGQLTAGVAHDINEPLANILGFAELIKKEEALSEQSRKDLDKIINSSIYARDIVRKLLIFTGKIMPGKTNLDLNGIIKESIHFFETRCKDNNIHVVLKLSKNPLSVYADPGHLHQVFTNLLVNSIQALSKGGRIELTSRRKGNMVLFSIEDDGIGIPEDIQKNIFVPFFTTKERGEGTGLGLATVLGIITSYKGEISVESKQNVYTRFTIMLPGVISTDE